MACHLCSHYIASYLMHIICTTFGVTLLSSSLLLTASHFVHGTALTSDFELLCSSLRSAVAPQRTPHRPSVSLRTSIYVIIWSTRNHLPSYDLWSPIPTSLSSSFIYTRASSLTLRSIETYPRCSGHILSIICGSFCLVGLLFLNIAAMLQLIFVYWTIYAFQATAALILLGPYAQTTATYVLTTCHRYYQIQILNALCTLCFRHRFIFVSFKRSCYHQGSLDLLRIGPNRFFSTPKIMTSFDSTDSSSLVLVWWVLLVRFQAVLHSSRQQTISRR